MSISSSVRKAGPYSCNGSTVVFPFAFKVFATADVRAVLADANGVESDLALGTNYTVTLNTDQDANPGGAITTTTTYAPGYKITLTSQVQNLQPVTLTNQGGFYPKIINDALDRLTIMAQQLAEQVGRAVKTNISSSSSSTPDQLLSDIGTAVTNVSNSATAAANSATASAGYATNSANSATASANSATAAANSAMRAADSAASVGFTLTDLQTQGKTAVTSVGTAPAFAVTTSPAYGALVSGQRIRVKFHAAGTTGSNTLNRDGLGAKNLMQYDATGAKVTAVITLGQLADVEYDGTDMVVLNPLPPIGAAGVPIRQTALAGPADSSGYPSFLPATSGSLSITSQNVTSSAPFVVTAANGFSAAGAVDRIGRGTANLTWSVLTANTTNYLYVDVAANGTLTPGSTTLAPTHQFGGSRSTVNGQATFNIQEMSMTVGNGAVASQAYRVFVGEADTNVGTVTATRAYAYQGRYESISQPIAAGTPTSFSHNLGIRPRVRPMVVLVAQATDAGYAVGDEISGGYELNTSTNAYGVAVVADSVNTVRTVPGANGVAAPNKSTGGGAVLTLANWKQKVIVQRGW